MVCCTSYTFQESMMPVSRVPNTDRVMPWQLGWSKSGLSRFCCHTFRLLVGNHPFGSPASNQRLYLVHQIIRELREAVLDYANDTDSEVRKSCPSITSNPRWILFDIPFLDERVGWWPRRFKLRFYWRFGLILRQWLTIYRLSTFSFATCTCN